MTPTTLRDRVAAAIQEARDRWSNDGHAHCAGGTAYDAMSTAAIRVVVGACAEVCEQRQADEMHSARCTEGHMFFQCIAAGFGDVAALREVRGAGCQCSDADACRFARERDALAAAQNDAANAMRIWRARAEQAEKRAADLADVARSEQDNHTATLVRAQNAEAREAKLREALAEIVTDSPETALRSTSRILSDVVATARAALASPTPDDGAKPATCINCGKPRCDGHDGDSWERCARRHYAWSMQIERRCLALLRTTESHHPTACAETLS